MSLFLALKALHIVGAAVLLGTGAGIAFFMLMAHRTQDPRVIAHTSGVVVIADTLFTATAVAVQPVTGGALAHMAGYPLFSGWVAAALALYVMVGAFWLPVVWMQLRFRDLAREAATTGAPLGAAYHRLFRLWFAFGFPAFGGVIAIIWLMVAKPAF
ncbi:DUF2269 domain-containing protein [Phenylobacterium sp. LjRoot219]|uniref:DUF2269 family protein n=1 Tax=Phenylobacterium sp. LjRoot219 TaxID=3342283 RepID=UPI003ECFAB39